MSKFNYSNSRNTAEKLIAKFGEESVVTIKGNTGGYDGFGNPLPPEPDINIEGLITPILSYTNGEIDNETIKMGDGYCFFHSTEEPVINCVTTINGKVWKVVDIDELTSIGGVNVYRKLQMRADG